MNPDLDAHTLAGNGQLQWICQVPPIQRALLSSPWSRCSFSPISNLVLIVSSGNLVRGTHLYLRFLALGVTPMTQRSRIGHYDWAPGLDSPGHKTRKNQRLWTPMSFTERAHSRGGIWAFCHPHPDPKESRELGRIQPWESVPQSAAQGKCVPVTQSSLGIIISPVKLKMSKFLSFNYFIKTYL